MSNETLVRCCAPTMACLKTGNMFSCAFDSREQMTAELRRLNQRLRKKGIRILPRRWRDGKALLYLYRQKLLEKDLCDPLCQRFAPFGKRKQRRFLHFVASRNSVVKPGS